MRATNSFPQAGGDTDPGSVIVSWTEVFDPSNSFDPVTGVFTVPSSGKYFVGSSLASDTVTVSSTARVVLIKNGATYSYLNTYINNVGVTRSIQIAGSDLVECVAGNTLSIGYVSTPISSSKNSNPLANYLIIFKMGL